VLKIVMDPRQNGRTLRLEGDVIGPWVDELRRSFEEALASGEAPTVDLKDVSFVDRPGLDLLQALARDGAALINASPFVAEQLRARIR
jgi:ABC-type transporter Mla MlaB component